MSTDTQYDDPRRERPAPTLRFGVFSTVAAADKAVANLQAAGFTHDEISVMTSDKGREAHFREFVDEKPAGTHTPAAAATGSVLGAMVGGLAAIAGMVTTGGLAVLAVGGLAAWTGGVVGGLVGAMMTRGVEKEMADYYDQSLTAGKILVGVDLDGQNDAEARSRLATAEQIIADAGAEPRAMPEE